jgi:hypothetical protein
MARRHTPAGAQPAPTSPPVPPTPTPLPKTPHDLLASGATFGNLSPEEIVRRTFAAELSDPAEPGDDVPVIDVRFIVEADGLYQENVDGLGISRPTKEALDQSRADALLGMAHERAKHEPGHLIRLVGGIWHIRFGTEAGDYPANGNRAITWLAMLLEKPNRLLSVADLSGDPDGKLAADAALRDMSQDDREALAAKKRRLREIDDIIEATGGSESLQNEYVRLLDAVKGSATTKKLASKLRRDHANIATQLRNFMRRLKDNPHGMPQLVGHLRASLKLELPDFGYFPPAPTPPWTF